MSLKKKPSKKPAWLPDWKDESKYPDPKKAGGRVWAWEFLRRNPKYQELWEEYAALPHGSVYSGYSAYALRDISERLEQDFGVRNPAPPEMTTADAEFEWRPIFIEQKPRHWVFPVNVSDDDEFEIPVIYVEDPAEIVVKFDLRVQIKPQLIYVGELLKKELKRFTGAKGPRARFENYPNYLRVLDAKLSGITHQTIGAEILKVKNPEYQKPKAV
jgi:transcriptional regulator